MDVSINNFQVGSFSGDVADSVQTLNQGAKPESMVSIKRPVAVAVSNSSVIERTRIENQRWDEDDQGFKNTAPTEP